MKIILFICVAIDIIFIFWTLRDLLLWCCKINNKIEIQEKMVEITLWMIEKFRKSNNLQANKLNEAFMQEKIRISAKRRIKKAGSQSCMMAEGENYAQNVDKYHQMKK